MRRKSFDALVREACEQRRGPTVLGNLEVRRDLLANPFQPFEQMTIAPAKVDRIAVPLAAALLRWW